MFAFVLQCFAHVAPHCESFSTVLALKRTLCNVSQAKAIDHANDWFKLPWRSRSSLPWVAIGLHWRETWQNVEVEPPRFAGNGIVWCEVKPRPLLGEHSTGQFSLAGNGLLTCFVIMFVVRVSCVPCCMCEMLAQTLRIWSLVTCPGPLVCKSINEVVKICQAS